MFPTFLMLFLIQPSSKMWQPPYKLFLLYFLPKEIDFNIAGPIKTSPKLNTFTIHIIDQQNPRNFASLLSRSWTSVLTRQSSLYMQLIPHTSPKRSIGAQGKSQQNKGKRTRWEAHVNCTTLDVNTVVGCLFHCLLNAYKKYLFFFILLTQCCTNNQSLMTAFNKHDMSSRKVDVTRQDESTWIAADVWRLVCAELGTKGTDRPQQLVKGSK